MTNANPDTGVKQSPQKLDSLIDGETFQNWRRERNEVQNIRSGKPYFNGPSKIPPPEKHSPSRLMQCHRKTYYQTFNAPSEEPEPAGIFWFGSQFETEIAVPFLQDVVGPNQIIRNSMWVDYTVDSDAGPLTIRGETDPVIVDRESTPLVLTEIKTASSVEYLDGPKLHHKAQAHAYMYGLSKEYNTDLHDALLLYGDRDSLELRVFHVPFDPFFWRHSIIDWAAQNTDYRANEELPPPTPEFDWECGFCSFKARCGQTDAPFEDTPPTGLLPLTKYPRKEVEKQLEAHKTARLTPTLAHIYPEVADKNPVSTWNCGICGATFEWDAIDWSCDLDDPPSCPNCPDDHPPGTLSGPSPNEVTTTEEQ